MTSARLATGTLSQDRPLIPPSYHSIPTYPDRESPNTEEKVSAIRGEIDKLMASYQTTRYEPEQTYATERPAWQAFLLTVQLHHPKLAADLEPAHKIGLLSDPEIHLSYEAINVLNYFIEQWYGMEVEVITTRVTLSPLDVNGYPENVAYCQPYRPITGLKVIVTHTYQWALDQYSRQVMTQREEWGRLGGVDSLKTAWKMYVHERVPTARPQKKRGKHSKWLYFFSGM